MRPVDFFILAVLIIAGGIYLAVRAGFFKRGGVTGRGRTGPNLNRAEQKVLEALEAEGYKLSRVHPFVSLSYKHFTSKAQKQKEYTHAANFVVTRSGTKYLVKLVKSGTKPGGSTNPATPEFRNELLIDYLLFLPGAILLYNTDKEEMEEVRFNLGLSYGLEKKFAGITFALAMIAALFWLVFYMVTEVFPF